MLFGSDLGLQFKNNQIRSLIGKVIGQSDSFDRNNFRNAIQNQENFLEIIPLRSFSVYLKAKAIFYRG